MLMQDVMQPTWDPSLLFLLTVIISSYLSAPNGVADFFPSTAAFLVVGTDLVVGKADCDKDLFCIMERVSCPKLLPVSPPEMD